jgi:hypothetical protein
MLKIKGMDLKKSILFFGIPGMLMFIDFEYFLPLLLDLGLSKLFAVLIMLATPIVAVFIFVMFQLRISNIDKSEFLYMKTLSKKQVLIAISLFLLVQSMEVITSTSRGWLSQLPGFKVPVHFPDIFMPQYKPHFPAETFMGTELSGNYMVI